MESNSISLNFKRPLSCENAESSCSVIEVGVGQVIEGMKLPEYKLLAFVSSVKVSEG
jgi:hypothetical protein